MGVYGKSHFFVMRFVTDSFFFAVNAFNLIFTQNVLLHIFFVSDCILFNAKLRNFMYNVIHQAAALLLHAPLPFSISVSTI